MRFMRLENGSLGTWMLVVFATLGAGCGSPGTTTGTDGGLGDAAQAAGDMACAASPTVMNGTSTIIFAELSGNLPVPTDGGVMQVPARLLQMNATFPAATAMHDYTMGTVTNGCDADHFTAMHLPPDDLDAGQVTITGFTSGKLLNMMDAPKEIDCVIPMGQKGYLCSFKGLPGPTGAYPFSGSATPLAMGDSVTMALLGGAAIGPLGAMTVAGPLPTLTTDLTTVNFKTGADVTLAFNCDGKPCGAEIIAVDVFFLPNLDPNAKPASSGHLQCRITGGSALTLKKEAIAAALGSDATLKFANIGVVRTPLANVHFLKDCAGHTAVHAVARGLFGVSPIM